MGHLDGARGDAELFFFRQAEDLAAGRPVNHMPECDAASVAEDCLLDEVSQHATNGLAIAFPEPDPIGQNTLAELDQGSDFQSEATPPRRRQLGVEMVPAELTFRGCHLFPRDVQMAHIEGAGPFEGWRQLLRNAIEDAAQVSRELGGRRQAAFKDLRRVRFNQEIAGAMPPEARLERLRRRIRVDQWT